MDHGREIFFVWGPTRRDASGDIRAISWGLAGGV